MSWDNVTTLRFIAEYRNRPVLWNKGHTNYNNKSQKDKAWCSLAGIFNEDVDYLKKKLDSLRGTRRREKSRMLRSTETESKPYQTKWFAWESFKFLDDVEDPDQKRGCNDEIDTDVEIKIELLPNVEPVADDEDNLPMAINRSSEETGHMVAKSEARTRHMRRRVKRKLPTEGKDEIAIFGEYVAAKLRKFDSRTRAILQNSINNLIFDSEMETISSSN